jgi:hypothetical protein
MVVVVIVTVCPENNLAIGYDLKPEFIKECRDIKNESKTSRFQKNSRHMLSLRPKLSSFPFFFLTKKTYKL